MKELRIKLTDEQHEKLTAKLQNEAGKNLEHSTLSGFSITLNHAFPGATWLTVDMNGELDLGDVDWEIK
ncbi:hypothetical protein FQU23_014435 [Flavobacterium sp. XN-5]|uniref:hypothetical protein n=1 Tax=Flavobacterium sp. XN-5 TaxID=2599390 RepID=UPI0011C74F6D|nr:hypothetical protein [Flavobacterium sp. XN-5]NGY38700.1 hypothetical protein [Flavobacterium sp. XN-5]